MALMNVILDDLEACGCEDDEDDDDDDNNDDDDDDAGTARTLTIIKMGLRRSMRLSKSEYT